MRRNHDVVILGAGLAGLTLARHLLLETDKNVLVLDRLPVVPSDRQKVGESTVQVAGYYLSKVLDLEEHLLRRHLMKYNLRFYWPTSGLDNDGLEDYSQSYIREISNVASYQLDRNAFERELLRLNDESPRFTLLPAVSSLEVELAEAGEHRVTFSVGDTKASVDCDWVVDATGRGRHLAKRQGLKRKNAIRHGAIFWWVDGLVNIEKLTRQTRRESRLSRDRRALGHLPQWLATNHFMVEGAWFWVIPLHGKTSLGLVFDPQAVSHDEVFSVEKATRWVCEKFPLFARDLPGREVVDWGGFRDFSHDCARTISPSRWATTGEAGRFSDPLYSPGSDLISIHNTLIVDAIRTTDREELETKCATYEQLMRSSYAAYEPSYATSYDALGDQETFSLKYVWELSVYFAFYVFPFINDLLTERRFQPAYLRSFSRLGAINAGIQELLSGFFQFKKTEQWKKRERSARGRKALFDFTAIRTLDAARETFYEVGVSIDEARRMLAEQLRNLEELARFTAAHVAGRVLNEPRALTNRAFVEGIDVRRLTFDPEEMARRYRECEGCAEPYRWSIDPEVLERFRGAEARRPAPAVPAALEEVA